MDDGVLQRRWCSACATDGAEARALLTSHEVETCRSLPERRRADFRAARLAARRALGELRRGQDREMRFAVRSRPGRSPVFTTDGFRARELSLSLSVTHRDGRGAAAVWGGSHRVGVDLERTDAIPPGHLTYFLGPGELDNVRIEAPALDAATLWTLKEAAWKALGLPRCVPLKALRLVFRGGILTELRHGGRRWHAGAELARPWTGYRMATVCVHLRGAS